MVDVRPLTVADAPICREAFRRMLSESFAEFPPNARRAYLDDWSEERFAERISNVQRVMLGAFNEAQLIGMLLGSTPEAGIGTIIWLWISVAERNQGVGQTLVENGCGLYRTLDCHKVRVFSSDERNHAFYQRCGMTQEGFHLSHWWGVDFWSLGKVLYTPHKQELCSKNSKRSA